MFRRRARPTLRVLKEDLSSGWRVSVQRRRLDHGSIIDLLPLSEVAHPLVEKALESFGDDPSADSPEGVIASSTRYPSAEIKIGQWRGAVWRDDATGVHWLVSAGLAKGGHQDRDDFYARLARAHEAGTADAWLPDVEDARWLKVETVSGARLRWELGIQESVLAALTAVASGGELTFAIPHPLPEKVKTADREVARVTVTVAPIRDDDTPRDEVVIEIDPPGRWAADPLLETATLRVLISIQPPEQSWDVAASVFSTFAEPDTYVERIHQLGEFVARGELGEPVPGESAHQAHRAHLAERTVEGRAVRGLCGVFFVPRQDYAVLPTCPRCESEHARLAP